MTMNAVRLRHAVAIDRAGSFSAAATALLVTQSTVTRSVAGLEREIGHPLFERGARGATATPEGREFLERAGRIVADLDMLAADARSGATARPRCCASASARPRSRAWWTMRCGG